MKWERTIRLSRPLVGIRSPDAEVRGLTPAGGSASHITPSSNLHADTTSPSAAGRADLQELHRLLQDVGHEISELEVRRADAIEELQHTAIELALAVAQQLAGELLERDVERTEHLVRQALAKLPAGEPIVVRLNPHDLARLSALEGCDWPRGVQWLADPSLKPGSCFAESPDFGLLATLEDRLDDIRQALREGLGDAQAERRQASAKDQKVRRFPDRRETA